MIKCKICGCEFPPVAEKHYIARDSSKSGIVTALSNDEGKLYDAFDCPMCDCQVIVQERKRDFVSCNEFDEALEMAMAKEDFEDE